MENQTPPAALRPEHQVLLCCARRQLDQKSATRLRRLLKEDLDWPDLLRAAAEHGLIPLLYHHLQAHAAHQAPPAVLSRLRDQVQRHTAWNLILTRELCRLLSLLAAQGIVAIPFKGPTLAALAYGDLSLRQFSDLDLLVPRQDVPRTEEVLISQGYRPELALSGPQKRAFRQSYYALRLVDEARGFDVDLHWELSRWFLSLSLNTQGCRERRIQLPLEGQMVPSLAPEDLLIQLCLHHGVHRWGRLSWVADVAALIEAHPEMDWPALIDRTGLIGCQRMLYLGLFLAQDLLETPLPEHIRQGLRGDPLLPSLAGQVRRTLFHDPIWPAGLLETTVFYLKLRENFRDRLRFCLHTLFSPTLDDFAFLPLSPAFSFLYCLVRPGRLVAQYLFGWKGMEK